MEKNNIYEQKLRDYTKNIKINTHFNEEGIEINELMKEIILNNCNPCLLYTSAFNFIAKEIPKEDFLEARRMIGDKMNTIIREQTQVRYDGIINDYKDYKKMNV